MQRQINRKWTQRREFNKFTWLPARTSNVYSRMLIKCSGFQTSIKEFLNPQENYFIHTSCYLT